MPALADAAWPMRIAPIGPVTCATVAWRAQRQLRVTAIVKATFAFAPDRPMLPASPDPIVQRDRHHGDDPARSVESACELAPYLAQTDVLLRGHARAFQGHAVPSIVVRLALASGDRILLDKRLLMRGYAPFEHMPITYELAPGGPQAADNPVGIVERQGREANIVDPQRPHQAAGFGPVARSWPQRARLLAGIDPRRLDDRIIELPDGFRWDYFQAAPIDQRIELLGGGEWLAFEGMHPALARLTTCLPGVQAAARVYGPSAEMRNGRPLALVADTLDIDVDLGRCSVLWRGNFPLAGEQELASFYVVAGLEGGGRSIEWPSAPPMRAPVELATITLTGETQAARAPALPFTSPEYGQASSGTVDLPPDAVRALRNKLATPFVGQPPRAEPATRPVGSVTSGLPFVQARPLGGRAAAHQPGATGTLTLSVEDLQRHMAAPATPFEAPKVASPSVDVPRPQTEPRQVMPSPPPPIREARRASPKPVAVDIGPPAGIATSEEPPKTLGAHFLAAMARAAQAPAGP